MGNKDPLKVLIGTKMILDDHGNNLDLFRSFRGRLLLKPVTGQELFFAVPYNKLALVVSFLQEDPKKFYKRIYVNTNKDAISQFSFR